MHAIYSTIEKGWQGILDVGFSQKRDKARQCNPGLSMTKCVKLQKTCPTQKHFPVSLVVLLCI